MIKLSVHWGLKKIVIGGLLLLNAFVWPMWLGIDGWIKFIAVVIVLCGVINFIYPHSCNFHGLPIAKNVKKKK